jgi:hypothetical protein
MTHQVSFDVVPFVGIGQIRFGMIRQDVRSVLPDPVSSFARWQAAPNSTDAFLDHAFQVDYNAAGEVEYIELSRRGPFDVFYKGTNVFVTEVVQLVDFIFLDAPYDDDDPELGSSYIFPRLALSLWRENVPEDNLDEDDQGQFFDTVGIGKPGYYDKPA